MIEKSSIPLSSEERRRLTAEVQDDVLGYGPLQRLLDDPEVTEVMVNGPEKIYIEKSGQLQQAASRFASEEHLRLVIERIVSRIGRRIDESAPMVDARLLDGSRVNAVIPPLAFNGSSLTIRKFSKDPFKAADLVRFGTLSPEMVELLDACVAAKLNVIVSGAPAPARRPCSTSFPPSSPRANASSPSRTPWSCSCSRTTWSGSSPVPQRRRQRRGQHPRSGAQLLRMRPDRIVVGEVRGGRAWTCSKR